jgi:hypothetical protein
VDAADGRIEVGVEDAFKVGEVVPQAVGVGDEHALVFEFHGRSFVCALNRNGGLIGRAPPPKEWRGGAEGRGLKGERKGKGSA